MKHYERNIERKYKWTATEDLPEGLDESYDFSLPDGTVIVACRETELEGDGKQSYLEVPSGVDSYRRIWISDGDAPDVQIAIGLKRSIMVENPKPGDIEDMRIMLTFKPYVAQAVGLSQSIRRPLLRAFSSLENKLAEQQS